MARIAIDVFKAIAPFWLSQACKRRQVGRGFVPGSVLRGAALEFLAEVHAAVFGGREAVNEEHRAVNENVERRRSAGPAEARGRARAVSVIEAAMAALRHDARWALSRGCTKEHRRVSARFLPWSGRLGDRAARSGGSDANSRNCCKTAKNNRDVRKRREGAAIQIRAVFRTCHDSPRFSACGLSNMSEVAADNTQAL
jgi:hypothetical protein